MSGQRADFKVGSALNRAKNAIGETKDQELIRRLVCYIDSLTGPHDYWKTCLLKREAESYLQSAKLSEWQR